MLLWAGKSFKITSYLFTLLDDEYTYFTATFPSGTSFEGLKLSNSYTVPKAPYDTFFTRLYLYIGDF